MLKLFEIVILWVYYTIPFGFSLIWHVWDISFKLLIILFWLRITDEGSVPEMRIWFILLIQSDLKRCIHLSRSLFLYFNYLVSVTAGGSVSPRGHMYPSSTVDFGWFVVFESINICRVKIVWNCNFVGLLHHPFWLQLDLARLGHLFILFWLWITDEGSVLEMLILSILLIQSGLKWCIHLSRSIFYIFQLLKHLIWLRTTDEGSVPEMRIWSIL